MWTRRTSLLSPVPLPLGEILEPNTTGLGHSDHDASDHRAADHRSADQPACLQRYRDVVELAEYERLLSAGETHWWFQATRALLPQLAAAHLPPATASTVYLDAAGGSGATGRWLAELAPTVLDDFERSVLDHARTATPGYLPAVADLNHLPHPDRCFDAVLCVTALCHRMNRDPQMVVDELARVTKQGGLVVLMEPGGRRLRRGHDETTQTGRRFSRSDLKALVTGADLELVRTTGAYSFLIPPAAILGVIERGRSKSDVGRNQSGLGGVLPALARAERALLRRTNLPVGLSVIAIARKPT
jgi:SAM-dependent methyltransferase